MPSADSRDHRSPRRAPVWLRTWPTPVAALTVTFLSAAVVALPTHGSPAGPAAVSAPVSAHAPAGAPLGRAELLARLDGERALRDVRRLSGAEQLCAPSECITVVNRLTGSNDLAVATDYVASELVAYGYDVFFEPWMAGSMTDRNVVARRAGVISPTEQVYFVAHVDGVAGCIAGRCPAADDNASGTAALLELARALSHGPASRTATFLFSTGEEQGTLGVRAHVQSLGSADLAAIYALVNLDMVGYDGNDDDAMVLYYGDHAPSLDLALTMQGAILSAGVPLAPEVNPGCG